MSSVSAAWLAIACFLVSSGADINHKNRAEKSPIDEVADPEIKEALQKFTKYVPTPLLLPTLRYEPIAFVESSD